MKKLFLAMLMVMGFNDSLATCGGETDRPVNEGIKRWLLTREIR